jgi:hypothetical protein
MSHEFRPAGRRRIRAIRVVLVMALLCLLFVSAAGGVMLAFATRLSAYHDVEPAVLSEAFKQVALDVVGERPRIAPNPPQGTVPICQDVPDPSIKPLRLAFGLMRGTDEGLRLFTMLVDNGVCVTVDDLAYNAAFAESRRTFPDDWSSSRIVVDRDLVRSGAADVLAAVLVHEATHIDRAVSGAACFLDDRCQRLPNGVEIDEEIAAHTAEAEWWIAAFGADGKRFAVRNDYGENRLARAYLRGPDAFRAFVTDYRSDPREGVGL